MDKKKIQIKNKLINHITKNGEKKTSEKLLLKSLKKLQKTSKKQVKALLQLCILNSTPIFKLHTSSNKKQKKRNKKIREMPTFIVRPEIRTSLSIKFILSNKEKMSKNFYSELTKKVLLTTQSKSGPISSKNELQKKIILNKRYLTYYRWT
jgi:ribosomal protein S7